MKHKLESLVAALLLAATMAVPLGITGCGSLPERPPRTVALDSMRATYDSALVAYENFMRLYVSGKVTPAKKTKVDAAWVKFSTAADLAVRGASVNWQATTSTNLLQLKAELIAAISSL